MVTSRKTIKVRRNLHVPGISGSIGLKPKRNALRGHPAYPLRSWAHLEGSAALCYFIKTQTMITLRPERSSS
ncbi:MAG: hypothetical protein LUQ47_03445 [Methanotrichaceae archaeon]|nr:hypothetical protein [Methanotrichaceae archaeon]